MWRKKHLLYRIFHHGFTIICKARGIRNFYLLLVRNERENKCLYYMEIVPHGKLPWNNHFVYCNLKSDKTFVSSFFMKKYMYNWLKCCIKKVFIIFENIFSLVYVHREIPICTESAKYCNKLLQLLGGNLVLPSIWDTDK